EVVLLEQVFIMDTDSKVGKFVEAAAKEIGSPIKIAGFERFTVGEGVERKEDDFADEVAKLAG
ncbi:MAG: elongation factor Ts, partial [Alphaproteobacteria bacterium]|nr:elongation factor Ts [Alphaproteobacteria bacterium]